jgi:hypothetical protein
MAAKDKAAKAGRAAAGLKGNPYVRRIVEDEDLRQNVWQAYESIRDAYARVSNGKKPGKKLLDDKKVQKDLKEAANSLREAGVALREGPSRRRRGGGLRRLFVIGLVGTGVALAVSEGLRKKVLDALFGAEEEFEYTSTTTATPAPAPPAETTQS